MKKKKSPSGRKNLSELKNPNDVQSLNRIKSLKELKSLNKVNSIPTTKIVSDKVAEDPFVINSTSSNLMMSASAPMSSENPTEILLPKKSCMPSDSSSDLSSGIALLEKECVSNDSSSDIFLHNKRCVSSNLSSDTSSDILHEKGCVSSDSSSGIMLVKKKCVSSHKGHKGHRHHRCHRHKRQNNISFDDDTQILVQMEEHDYQERPLLMWFTVIAMSALSGALLAWCLSRKQKKCIHETNINFPSNDKVNGRREMADSLIKKTKQVAKSSAAEAALKPIHEREQVARLTEADFLLSSSTGSKSFGHGKDGILKNRGAAGEGATTTTTTTVKDKSSLCQQRAGERPVVEIQIQMGK